MDKILKTPRAIAFWYQIVAIAISSLAQHPTLYNNGQMLLGLWAGTFTVAMVGAGVIAGLGYLLFSATLKDKAWQLFVVVAWMGVGLQLLGEWAFPRLVQTYVLGKEVATLTVESIPVAPTVIPPAQRQTSVRSSVSNTPRTPPQAPAGGNNKASPQPQTATHRVVVPPTQEQDPPDPKQPPPTLTKGEPSIKYDFAGARKAGFPASGILDYFGSKRFGNDRLAESIAKARKEGHDDEEILYYIEAGKPLK